MTASARRPGVDVNGTRYRWPARPAVVVCIDGGEPADLRQYLPAGAIPSIAHAYRRRAATKAPKSYEIFDYARNGTEQ